MPTNSPPVDEVSRFAALYDKVSRPLRDLTPAGRAATKKSKYNLDMRTLNPALVQDRRTVRTDIGVDGPRHVDNDAVLQRAVTRQRNRAIVGLRNPGNEGTQPEMPGYRLEYMANVCALEEEDRISGTAVANRVLDSKSTVADALHRHGDNAMRRRNLEDNLAQWQVKMGENVAAERLETLAREEEMEREAQETTTANLEVETMGNTFKDTFDRLTQLNFFVERVVTDAKHNLEVRGAFRRPTKSMGTATDLSFFSGIKATTTSTLDHSDDEGGDGSGNRMMTTSMMSSSVPVGASVMGASKVGSPNKGDKDKVARILEDYEEKINELQGRLGRRTEALINALKMVEAVEKQHKRNERSSDKTIRSKDDEMLRLRMYIEALETGVGFTQRWEWRGEAGEDDDASATKFIATAMQIARDEAKKEHQKAMAGKQRDVLEASRRRDILNYVEHEDSAMQLRDQMAAVERSRDQLRELLETAEETVERQADALAKMEAECTISRSKLLVADSDLAASVKLVAELNAKNEELETTLRDTLSNQEGTQLDAQELLDERDAEVEKLRQTVADLSQGLHMATLEQEIADLRTTSQQHAREASDLRERNTAVKKLNGALETRIKALESNETQMMETVCQVASSMLRGVTEERAVLGKKVPPLQLTSRPIYQSATSPKSDTPPSPSLSPSQPSLLRSPRSNSGADNARVLVADRKHAGSVVRFHFVSQHRLWELTSSMAEELDNLVRSVAAPLIQSPDEDAPHIDCGDGERLPDTTAGRVLRDLRGMQRQSTPAHFQQVESHLRVVVDDAPLAMVSLHPVPHVLPDLELMPLVAPTTPTHDAISDSTPEMGALLPSWADDVVRLQAIVTKVSRLLALRTNDQQLGGSSASNALWALRGMSAALANEVAAPIYRLRQDDPAKVVAEVVDGPFGPINVDSHLQEILVGIPGQVSRCLWRKVLETVRARRSLLNKSRQAEVRVATAMARLKEATYQCRHNATSPVFIGLESVLSVAHISVRALVQSYIATFPSRSPNSRSRPTSAVGGPSRGVADALLNMGRTLDEIREAQDTYGGVVGSSGGGAWLKWFDMDSELHPPYASMLMSSEDGRISALHRQRLRLITELQAIDDVDTRFIAKQARRNQAVLDALGGSSTPIESPSRPSSAAVPPPVHLDDTPTSDIITPPDTPTARDVPAEQDVPTGSLEVSHISVDVPALPVASSHQGLSPRDRHSRSASHTAPHSPGSSTQGNSPPSTTRSVNSDQDPKEMASTCLMERTTSFRPNNSGTVAPTTQPIAPHPTITPAVTVATHQLVAASVREAIQQIVAALKDSPKGYHAPFDISRGVEVQAVLNRIRRASVGDVPNLQRADDVVAQLYPKLLAAIAHRASTPAVKAHVPTSSVFTQCELPPAADSPWIRGRELAERIVTRNRPTSAASSHGGRPTSAPTARNDVYSDVVETLMPTYNMMPTPSMGLLQVEDDDGTIDTKSVYSRQSSVLNRRNSGDHSVYTSHSEVPHDRPSRPASAQHRGGIATPRGEEATPQVKQLVEENQVLATHVQNLQQHITEVKKNLKTFLQQAVGENIMRPLPDGTWARESELTFTEKPASKPDRPKVDLVVSDPMKFMLRRDTSREDGVVLRGASGRPLFVPRRIPQAGQGGDTIIDPNDFYPPASPLHTRPPSAGGLPMLQQQVLRHISDHVPLAVSDVSVGTDGIEAEYQPPILSPIPTNGIVDVVVPKDPLPPKVATAQTTSSTQTPDELLSMYVMRLSAGLTPSGVPANKKAKHAEPARQASPMDQLRVQPSGVLLRPVPQASIADRSWTVDNPAASSTPVRRVSRPTVPDGAISVPLGGSRVVSRSGIGSAATRVNCPPVFTSGATDGEQNTGPFSERQINLYPPHRHWSDRTDDNVNST